MKLDYFWMRLPLKDPFTIARGTITYQDSLVVRLQHNGLTGWGEVTANEYYGHSLTAMTERLNSLSSQLLDRYVVEAPEAVWESALSELQHDRFAVSALDMAAHDWWAKQTDQPVWQRWGLEWNPELKSSFTIGIDTIPEMLRKLRAQPNWPIYKIKLGTAEDLDIIRALREQTDAVFRVDANCGWTAQETIDNSRELAALNVQYIEQPLAPDAAIEDRKRAYEQSALPLIADENCQIPEDLPACFETFHGINVKLCKCGGMTPGLQMLQEARRAGKRTMIGCMVESAIGISGAAQLGPLLDYADLDGANLISGSPTVGVNVIDGEIAEPLEPGIGASLELEQLNGYPVP